MRRTIRIHGQSKTAGHGPSLANSAEQNGTVPLSPAVLFSRPALASPLALAALALAVLTGCGVGQPTASEAVPPPTGPVYVELPAGWQATRPTNAQLVQSGENPAAKARFTMALESAADYGDDLAAWAAAVKLNTSQTSQVTDRQETELTSGRIGEHPVFEYQITGRFAGKPGHLRVIMLRVGDSFCKLTGISFDPASWDAAQPKFDELIGGLRVNDKKNDD